MGSYEARCGDDEMVTAIRNFGNRMHTVQVWSAVRARMSRPQMLARLKYLETHGRVKRADTAYKVAIVWSAVS